MRPNLPVTTRMWVKKGETTDGGLTRRPRGSCAFSPEFGSAVSDAEVAAAAAPLVPVAVPRAEVSIIRGACVFVRGCGVGVLRLARGWAQHGALAELRVCVDFGPGRRCVEFGGCAELPGLLERYGVPLLGGLDAARLPWPEPPPRCGDTCRRS